MGAKKDLTDHEKGIIEGCLASGMTNVAIAQRLGRSEGCIRRFRKQPERGDDDNPRINSVRKRKTTARMDRSIIVYVKRNRFVTAPELARDLQLTGISLRTIQRRIGESSEFTSYWASRKPFLRKANITKRLAWAQAHVNWTEDQWRRVMWTDESPYVLVKFVFGGCIMSATS